MNYKLQFVKYDRLHSESRISTHALTRGGKTQCDIIWVGDKPSQTPEFLNLSGCSEAYGAAKLGNDKQSEL